MACPLSAASKTTSRKAVHLYPRFLKYCRRLRSGQLKTALVNTLSTENFENFEMNVSGAIKPCSQWKTHMECHVDGMAVTAAQSAVGASGQSTGSRSTGSRMRKLDKIAKEKLTAKRWIKK